MPLNLAFLSVIYVMIICGPHPELVVDAILKIANLRKH